jgi:hypothetical protein
MPFTLITETAATNPASLILTGVGIDTAASRISLPATAPNSSDRGPTRPICAEGGGGRDQHTRRFDAGRKNRSTTNRGDLRAVRG